MPTREWVTKEEIHNYFWPIVENKDRDEALMSSPHSVAEEVKRKHEKTLHDSAATPGKLAYVLLFRDHGNKPANPRWNTDGIIFTKSNLGILPGYQESLQGHDETDSTASHVNSEPDAVSNGSKEPTTTDSEPLGNSIAVFKQVATHRFDFEGWYKIERVAFLAPHSDELVRMLEQKWSWTNHKSTLIQSNRKGVDWDKSLNLRWAVVKLCKDSKADEERGPPKIVHLPDPKPQFHNKGVNELLAQMRLKDVDVKSAEGSAADSAEASAGAAEPQSPD